MRQPNHERAVDNGHAVGSRDAEQQECCGGASACDPGAPSRRQFIKLAGSGAASLAVLGEAPATGAADQSADAPDHFVPADKKLSPEWIEALSAKGGPTFYSGDDLQRIAMPVGGLCAGQLYLAGDGRLMHWDIFNKRYMSGYGKENYRLDRRPQTPLDQGFALRVQSGGKTEIRGLDRKGFPGVRFCGEYPIGTVEYRDPDLPVSVTLEAFSPFVPLDAEDSALPATVMQFTLKNTSEAAAEVTLAGWLQNGVCPEGAEGIAAVRRNRLIMRDAVTMILGSLKPTEPAKAQRPPIVLADFEGDDYGDWKVEGEAFGKRPVGGTLENQQTVSGFQGKGLVNTYLGGDDRLTGKLTSPKFKIQRRFISFLVAGGNYSGQTCINLVVDGKAIRTAVGKRVEKLVWHNWDVGDLAGREAHVEIVDATSEPWGHINIDQIELRDVPRAPDSGELTSRSDFGTMALAVLAAEGETLQSLSLPDGPLPANLLDGAGLAGDGKAEKPPASVLRGGLGKKLTLQPGGQARVTFLVTWCFPNRPHHGNYYAKRFHDAATVAGHLAANFERLARHTRLWHDTWYDSTMPHWLLDRLFSTVSNLATSTCQWWRNGRFWAWEGVGCCRGTCTHVWNYEHAMARLFPELERSAREMQDYGTGFVEETGMVRFRGEGWRMWAGDGQAGTVLKAYREHQMSPDDQFLNRNWPKIRKSLEFLVREDGNADGLIEGTQHNTYDINFYGPNTMVGSLYLAALRAAEEMARESGDDDFARQCRGIFERGSKLSVEQLFNGEYFIQEVDLQKHPKAQYADGCLSDQLFGQGWAHQVGLGYVYPKANVEATLGAIWKYNWAPDIGPQNEAHPPERWFAHPGEAGLFTCTWPRSKHMAAGVRYKNEVWTGIEYQVAGNMAWEGMVTEALAICRGVHERYHPAKHNPFNEVECGDHYARAMASFGVLLGLCGYRYHGPKAELGFAPRITPDDFRAAFTAAEGWGTISQQRQAGAQANRIQVKWGKLRLKSLVFELPEDATLKETTISVAGRKLPADAKQDGRTVKLTLAAPVVVEFDQEVEAALKF